MKKLLNKKNNKGFSLVELIVVVLIMGIIAVALAPQVMKWVETARDNSDENTAKDIKSAVQIAIAESRSKGEASSAGTYTVSSTGIAGFPAADEIVEVLGGEYPQTSSSTAYSITIDANDVVTVTY